MEVQMNLDMYLQAEKYELHNMSLLSFQEGE